MATRFEWYSEGGGQEIGYDDLQDCVEDVLVFREDALREGDLTDIAIQAVEYDDEDVPVQIRQMEIDADWVNEPEAILRCLRAGEWTWSPWQPI